MKHRREAVESELQQIFWSGPLVAFYISRVDGGKVDIYEAGVFHVDVSGERRGFTIYIDTKESEAVLATYFQGEPKEAASQAVSSPRSESHEGTAGVGRPSLRTEIENACNELISAENADLERRNSNYEPIRQIIRRVRGLTPGAYIKGLGDEVIRKAIAPILDKAKAASHKLSH